MEYFQIPSLHYCSDEELMKYIDSYSNDLFLLFPVSKFCDILENVDIGREKISQYDGVFEYMHDRFGMFLVRSVLIGIGKREEYRFLYQVYDKKKFALAKIALPLEYTIYDKTQNITVTKEI